MAVRSYFTEVSSKEERTVSLSGPERLERDVPYNPADTQAGDIIVDKWEPGILPPDRRLSVDGRNRDPLILDVPAKGTPVQARNPTFTYR